MGIYVADAPFAVRSVSSRGKSPVMAPPDAEPMDIDARGIIYGVALSVPLWGLIGGLVWFLLS